MNTSSTEFNEQIKTALHPLAKPAWQVKLLYDGECPLCLKEVNFLMKRDAGQGIISFVDISDLDYAPEKHGDVSFEAAMGRIHAVLPDNRVIDGVEVFRCVYNALGMSWVYAITKWPIIGPMADWIYDIWAALRLRITGRPNLVAIVAERQKHLEAQSLGRCRIDGGHC